MTRYRRWPSYQAWRESRSREHFIHDSELAVARWIPEIWGTPKPAEERHYYSDDEVEQMFGSGVLQELQRLRDRQP